MSDKQNTCSGGLLGPLSVIDLLVDGGAMARTDGKVVFLDCGIPGDVVMAKVTQDTKKFYKATVVEFCKRSPHAVTPWCPSAEQCGGCAWQNLDPAFLLEWKGRHVQQTLTRVGGVNIPVAPVTPSPLAKEFRTRMAYAFGTSSQEPALGLRKRGSQDIIAIPECGLQRDSGVILKRLRELLLDTFALPVWQDNKEGFLRFAVLHTPSFTGKSLVFEGQQTMLELIVGKEREGTAMREKAIEALTSMMEEGLLTGFVVSERKAAAALAQGERTLFSAGQSAIAESYQSVCGGQPILYPHNTFMQTNTAVADLLMQQVRKSSGLAPEDALWDLYCGVGAMGLALAEYNPPIFGADIQKDSILQARRTSRGMGLEHTDYAYGLIDKSLDKTLVKANIVVLDPPRSGVEPAVLQRITASTARTLLYVSCDVATQARDIKLLTGSEDTTKSSAAWQAVQAFPFDMFPGTPHIENLVVLERKKTF